eukprot:CAMPEP_0182490168 /NCGR_PEP_ID=MMETSP1321-20130603/128_1 /TAXON_ID=91990 /ORGANISM="Bolidomonas sp., Strain RCC1657" /LENGTH=309 /DNA_ID=CAMNT_0024692309 /DNA_START=21 /DNA_END=950 /DNA_ORIENTATION=+
MPLSVKRGPVTQADRDDLRRERNRAHARKTRERKKMRLEALTIEFEILKNQGLNLRQQLRAKQTASILLNLSGADSGIDEDDPEVQQLLRGTMARTPEVFVPGTGAKIDDEDSDDEGGGKRSKKNANMSQEMRLSIRRERNKMHAKATRERKKAYLDAMEKAISIVNDENSRLSKMLGNASAPSIMTIMTSMKADKSLVQEIGEADSGVVEDLEEDHQAEGGERHSPMMKEFEREGGGVGSSAVSDDGEDVDGDNDDNDSTSGEQGSVAGGAPQNPSSPQMHGMITPSVSGSGGGSGNESLSDDESEDM